MLSGNRATLAYLERIGARTTLVGPPAPAFDFVDVARGTRWTVRPSAGRLPWWIFDPARRVPGTRWRDYFRLLALRHAGPDTVVADVLGHDALAERLLTPLAIAALNTPPEEALARLMARVVDETLLQGGQACIPLMPAIGLSESFVDPAIAWLADRGATVATGRRVSELLVRDERVTGFVCGGEAKTLAPTDIMILAVPAPVAAELVPELTTPDAFQAIVNLHFAVTPEQKAPGFVGVIGGTAEWVFVKSGHVSVTISAANRLVDRSADELAAEVWPDVCRSLGLTGNDAGVAGGQGAARDDRRDRRAGAPAAGCRNAVRQSGARRRLDGDRVARNDRRCHQVRPCRRRDCAARRLTGSPCRITLPAAEPTIDWTPRSHAPERRWRAGSGRMGTGPTSLRPTPRSPPNMCCLNTISTGSSRSLRRRSASISAPSPARTADGRCSTTGRSTSRPA